MQIWKGDDKECWARCGFSFDISNHKFNILNINKYNTK